MDPTDIATTALASLLRARSPGGYVGVPPVEKGTGLHALASAGATLALIVMMIVFSKRYEWLFDPLVLVAALALSARFYLARRESENLHAQSRAQQEQLVAQNERLRELEPHVAGIAALHVLDTGIVDYARVCGAHARTPGGGRVARRPVRIP